MANEEHLALLKQGVEVWNEWRKNNPEIIPDLSEADFSKTNLKRANLNGAFLNGANLSGAWLNEIKLIQADLTQANLIRARLSGADLSGAYLSGAYLSGAYLSGAYLSGAYLSGAALGGADLSGVNLNEADLSGADLSGVNLDEANLDKADLNGASLSRTQVLGTNFNCAILTGACIEDWHINSETELDNVICEYVYLKRKRQERRPHNENKNFAPGEFTKLFQKARETVDLIFRNGIDWQAFLTSFQQLKVECGGEEISIQAIENKNNGAFVIRVNVSPEANKAEIEKYLKREYKLKLKEQENLLKSKDEEIIFYRQQNTNLLEIVKTMAEKENSKYYIHQSPIGNIVDAAQPGSHQESTQYIYAPEPKQNLAEAAAEIQRLLKQLEETNPTATEAEQQAYVTASIPLTLRARFRSALQAGWKEAVKEFLDNPYVNVGIAILEGWQEAE